MYEAEPMMFKRWFACSLYICIFANVEHETQPDFFSMRLDSQFRVDDYTIFHAPLNFKIFSIAEFMALQAGSTRMDK